MFEIIVDSAANIPAEPVSYTHLRAHETWRKVSGDISS